MNETISKIELAEQRFQNTEHRMGVLREFFVKHPKALEQCEWSAYGWVDTEIDIMVKTWGENQLTAKQIAALFGPDGWRRQANKHACGSIDWFKALDGCTLKISGAESIAPKLIEEVKFNVVD